MGTQDWVKEHYTGCRREHYCTIPTDKDPIVLIPSADAILWRLVRFGNGIYPLAMRVGTQEWVREHYTGCRREHYYTIPTDEDTIVLIPSADAILWRLVRFGNGIYPLAMRVGTQEWVREHFRL